jgi:drug/metabolite transporter (DMT)-like permease
MSQPCRSIAPPMFNGILFFVISCLSFTGMHLMVKACAATFPSEQLMFWRGATGLVILLSAYPFLRKRPALFDANWRPVFFRAFFGSIALFCFYKSISLIRVADATMLCYTYPVFLTLFAAIFLKERFGRRTALLLVGSIVGVVLILKPGFSGDLVGKIAGILSGVFSGLALLFVVQLRRRNEPTFTIVFWFFLVGSLLSAFFARTFVPVEDLTSAAKLATIGLFSLLAQISMTAGYKHVSAAAGGTLSLMTVPFTALGALLAFSEVSDTWSLTGGALVLLSAGFTAAGQRANLNVVKNVER